MEDLADDLMEILMMIRRTRMRLEVVIRTKGEIIPFISMIRIIEIREEEAEDKDPDDEASLGNVFTIEKKNIENLNVPSKGRIDKRIEEKVMVEISQMILWRP